MCLVCRYWVCAVGLVAAAVVCRVESVVPASPAGEPPPARKDAPPGGSVFDPDPDHPWNRLHRVFYVREVGKDRTYAYDGLEAPFGRDGPFLVEGRSHTKALDALDAFLKDGDDAKVRDPVKRALLQRDLWYVFDKLAEPTTFTDTDPVKDRQPERRAVQKRLAQVMRRLELTADQIRKLPDTYAATVKGGAFPAKFDPDRPDRPYLPDDLRLDNKGEWVPISRWYPVSGLSAPAHARELAGKAVVVTLLRLPGGRKPTEEFISRLPRRRGDGKPEELPELPDGSQVALVRVMLLADDRGTLRPTPVTEGVQLRVFPKGKEQRFFEFTLDRAGLASGRAGLRAVGRDEIDYFGGLDNGHSQIDRLGPEELPKMRPALATCIGCHNAPKLEAINTFGFGRTDGYQGGTTTDMATQVRHTVNLKVKSYSWGLLLGLREATLPEPARAAR
jgi:hypothetical protein